MHNAKSPPLISVPLDLFAGLYTEASPDSLPSGVSPLCINDDFTIGQVSPRPGTASVYSFENNTSGPLNCNSGTDVSLGLTPWANPGNITVPDGNYATVTPGSSIDSAVYAGIGADVPVAGAIGWANPTNIEGPPDSSDATVTLSTSSGSGSQGPIGPGLGSGWTNASRITVNDGSYATITLLANNTSSPLIASDFGFSIPLTASILGIAVSIIHGDMNGISALTDSDVQLLKAGSPVGSNLKHSALNIWASPPQTFGYGGSANLWGTTWAPSDINNSGFGVYLRVENGPGSDGTGIAGVDYISVTVYYSTGASGIPVSDFLQASDFGFDVPSTTAITGLQVTITGSQDNSGAIAQFSAQLMNASGMASGTLKTGQLPSSAGTLVLGSSSDMWGLTLTPALVNSANFGLQIQAFFTASTAGQTCDYSVDSVQITVFYASITGTDELLASDFGFTVAALDIQGISVGVTGHLVSSGGHGSPVITAQLVNHLGENVGETRSIALTSSDARVVLGGPLDDWGAGLISADVNSTAFGVAIIATGNAEFFIDLVDCTINQVAGNFSFNYIKSFEQEDGEILTLALSSSGEMYQEDVINDPGVMAEVFGEILPNSFAQSATVDDREFIAFSNLLNGTDIPRTYTPPNFDRLSQVGPGAPPSASTTSSGETILTITQNPKVTIPTSGGGTTGSWVLWSAAPQDTGAFGTPATPGNVMTWFFPFSFALPAYITVGSNIVISGVQTMNGYNPNNGAGTNPPYYTINSVGQPIAGQDYYAGFTITLPETGFFDARFQNGSAFQSTIATMTTAAQIPNLEVGNQFQISGSGGAPPAGYDDTWLVLTTPNAAQMEITSTSLTGNVASYGFVLISGTTPSPGQFVTVTLTLNGNGVFNVTNAVIVTASAGNFTVNITSPNVPAAAETGSGIIFGTIFTFDAFLIVGNTTGGQVVVIGIIAQGIRGVCYSFLTRNGFLTQPSPVLMFDVPAGASSIAIANLLTGPANVIARVIHLTAANGGNYYNIPVPVSVNDNGTVTINSSTWVNDNVSTNVTLSFSDAVLLAADEIDIQGNNLFECSELGSCVALIPFASRLAAIGEQNKIFNLLNYSFDGGYVLVPANTPSSGTTGGTTTNPAGWTVDPTNGSGGSVTTSPVFGFAYTIINESGSTQPVWGMITQPAFQDEDLVPIIEAATTYSVRVTVQVPSAATEGDLVIDLYSPKAGKAVGTFTLPLASIGTSMAIFTGTLLTTALAPVPNDLLIRVYATNIDNGIEIDIDRLEPFPTQQPNLNQQIILSYVNNFEAFDRVTGIIGTAVQNQQAVKSAFSLFDSLYIVKIGSFISTTDNGSTEPSGWSTRTVSSAVGTSGPYATTTGIDEPNSGEEWSLIGGRAGLFIFTGGEPISLSEEIQSLWNLINWQYGQTVWVKNDITNRRILVGVPLKVPNTWFPTGLIPDDSNPTTPNVILELNYRQLNTSGALSGSPEVHRSYSGKLIASEIVRKWSIWTIAAPCAAFITRDDGTAPIFLGNSADSGKIYQFIEGLLEDDGEAFTQIYNTYAFVGSDQGQGMQLGLVRYSYDYMSVLLTGIGEVVITVFPNSLDSPYSHILLPNLTLPASTNGDVELPLNEEGSRLFLQFSSTALGAGFTLTRIVMVMRPSSWSPTKGRND